MTALAARFPPEFLWGAATSAFQIEGAPDEREPTIWDVFGPPAGDACDHVRRYREDVALMAELGLTAYRFSISGTRGLDFYDRLVDAMLERGIRPFATLYHWDLPLAVQERGGWGSEVAVDWLAGRAADAARRLGDRVRDWITLNEPAAHAFVGHLEGRHAPGIRDWALALRVADRLLQGHEAAAAALRAGSPQARVGIAVDIAHVEPAGDEPDDLAAAIRLSGHADRWFLDPVFGRPYPEDLVVWYERRLGLDLPDRRSREPLDFLGINYYTRHLVRAGGDPVLDAHRVPSEGGERTEMGWQVFPEGLGAQLRRVDARYGPLPLFVTENGAAFAGDARRLAYLKSHLEAAAGAIEDGMPLEGYFVWSLLDNYEWDRGYGARFGIVEVDYRTQRRAVRGSGRWYQELIAAWRRVHGR